MRGTVRSLGKPRDVETLRQLPGAAARLELVEADLMRPGSFGPAAVGCERVIHTASPYVLDVQDAARDLVLPALEGTRAVLGACVRAGSVTRLVLTSSIVAINDEPPHDRLLTEADWNRESSLDRNPYSYSKAEAERAAWAFVQEEEPRFDLVVINPSLVLGPSLMASLNTSNQVLARILSGRFPAVISLAWGVVDVRDVAEAHVRAMENPAAHGRYICSAETLSMRAIVDLLAGHGYRDGYKLPTRSLESRVGGWLAYLSSYAQPHGMGSYLRTHVGRVPRFDTTKIRTELGLSFRPASETILETIPDLERWGHVARR